MTFQWYLLRQNLLAIVGVLIAGLLLISTSRLLQYTEDALNGKLEMWVALSAIGLRLPEFMLLFLPLAVIFGVYIAFSRLWVTNEITAAHYAGISTARMERVIIALATAASLVTLALSLWVAPAASDRAARLLEESKVRSGLLFLDTGAFHLIGDRWNIYAQARERNALLGQIGAVREPGGSVELFWSNRLNMDPCALLEPCLLELSWPSGLQYVHLAKDGHIRSTGGMQQLSVPQTSQLHLRSSRRTALPASASDHTRLQWHLSMALYLLVATLLALPLARVAPRQARFRRLPAVMALSLLYLALVLAGRQSFTYDELSAEPGLWPLHGAFLLLAIVLNMLARRTGGGQASPANSPAPADSTAKDKTDG